MRQACAVVLLLFSLTYQSAQAQELVPIPLPADEIMNARSIAPSAPVAGPMPACQRPVFWTNTEYLLWRIKNEPLPPLVTTGNPADPFPGALGQPGTNVLFGGSQSYGNLNGLRFSLGGWFGQSNLGWEVSGFLLERGNVTYANSSNAAGNPSLFIPFFRPDQGREGSFTVAQPFDPVTGTGGFNGSVYVAAQSRLWGTEFNFLYNLSAAPRARLNLIAGFRYLDLQDNLTMNTLRNDFIADVQNNIQDSFNARNQFYGGQLGAQTGATWGKLSLDVIGKVALGVNHQTVTIAGSDTVSGTGALNPGTFSEGIFAQASNSGHRSSNAFAVVPQTQVKLSYALRPWLVATAGYDFLYWSKVVRAGDQIDRRIDLTQSNVFNGPGAPAATFPQAPMHRSDFWAQGVSLGLVFRY